MGMPQCSWRCCWNDGRGARDIRITCRMTSVETTQITNVRSQCESTHLFWKTVVYKLYCLQRSLHKLSLSNDDRRCCAVCSDARSYRGTRNCEILQASLSARVFEEMSPLYGPRGCMDLTTSIKPDSKPMIMLQNTMPNHHTQNCGW
jgi:hypothetical protein